MDVCHSFKKSSASLCMSTDETLANYYTVSRDQEEARKDIVDKIKIMMKECLEYRLREKKSLPDNILFYRDGVGEGMYEQVLSNEVRWMSEAFAEVYGKNPLPKLTLVIVQKRNHLRSCALTNNSNMPGVNPPVGTLIDQEVVDRATNNFYLYSHKALQGTARPTHYQILLDELKIASKLPRLTYALAHMHQACTKSVSLPAPVFYADKACGRAHDYFDGKDAQNIVKKGLFMI